MQEIVVSPFVKSLPLFGGELNRSVAPGAVTRLKRLLDLVRASCGPRMTLCLCIPGFLLENMLTLIHAERRKVAAGRHPSAHRPNATGNAKGGGGPQIIGMSATVGCVASADPS